MLDRQVKRRKLSPASELTSIDTIKHETQQAYAKHTPYNLPINTEPNNKQDERVSNINSDASEDENGATIINGLQKRKSKGSLPLRECHIPASTNSLSNTETFQIKTSRLVKAMANTSIKQQAHIESLLRKLKSVIEETPEQEPISASKAEKSLKRLHQTAVPFDFPRAEANVHYRLGYIKPSMINVVGSYALKMAKSTSQAITLDLAVVMPESLFSEKDYLNHRYLHKRAFYLASIAAHIKKTLLSPKVAVKYTYLNGNPFLPAILVHFLSTEDCPDSVKQAFSVQILPTIREDVFPPLKTLPDCNCLKFGGRDHATPFYNATIRNDALVMTYLKFLHRTAAHYPSFKNGCFLGRAWLQKRGLDGTVVGGGFGHFEWMTVMAILLQTGGPDGKPTFLPTYDGIQLFRSMLQFLAQRDLSTKPFYAFDTTHLQLDENPIFFDGRRFLNLLYKMTPVSYRILRYEAQASLRSLNKKTSDLFEPLFGSHLNEPILRYDMIAYVPLLLSKQAREVGQDKPFLQQKALELHSILSRGLGDRIHQLSVQWPAAEPWTVELAKPLPSQSGGLVAKMSLDAQKASRVLDRGPSVEDAEGSAAFKDFWGKKTELRRFKDGAMNYSILWSGKEPAPLVEEICLWILDRHLSPETSKLSRFQYLSSSQILQRNEDEYRAASDQIRAAYKDLEETLRGLKTLPLNIRSLQPSSSLLTSTSLRNPIFDTCFTPADIVVQLESSGQWPDELRAIQMTKAAFLIKLADLLLSTNTSNEGNLSCRIGLENPQSDILNRSFLDITYAIGVTFRIRLHHERECTLLERHVADTSLGPAIRDLSRTALASYKRTFIKRPVHTQAISRAASQFPAFPGTVRLLRAWFSSHLLSTHIREEFLELLSANAFIHPEPLARPATPWLGFLRTITFLAFWNWGYDPLIVDFGSISGSNMKGKAHSQIHTQFEAWRAIDPTFSRVAMIAATDFDIDGTTWTADAHPSRLIASRIVALARSAHSMMSASGLQLHLMSLFVPNLKEFDFILHLSPEIIESRNMKRAGDTKRRFKNLHSSVSQHVEASDSSSIVETFINEIENMYSTALILFYNAERHTTNNVIAGIWNPSTTRERWKASLGFSSKPLGQRGRSGVQLDALAVLNEILHVGDGIISKVEINRASRFE